MPLGDGALEVGRVLRTHGREGELVVRVLDDDPGSLLRARRVLLDAAPGVIPYRVSEAWALGTRPADVRVQLRLGGLDTRERALAWVGARVLVEETALVERPGEELYGRDLLGLRCSTVDGRVLGTVAEIWPTAGCDQLLIVDGDQKLFLPARDEVLVEVAPAEGRLVVDLDAIGLELPDSGDPGEVP